MNPHVWQKVRTHDRQTRIYGLAPAHTFVLCVANRASAVCAVAAAAGSTTSAANGKAKVPELCSSAVSSVRSILCLEQQGVAHQVRMEKLHGMHAV